MLDMHMVQVVSVQQERIQRFWREKGRRSFHLTVLLVALMN